MKRKDPRPPAWANRFLEWYCDPKLLEDLQGDLHERFESRARFMGGFRAKLLFIVDVLLFLRPYTLRRGVSTSFLFMLSHYFKFSLRSLSRHKLHTSLILAGLTLSIAAFLLVFLYVDDELKYDRHYDKADRIYKLTTEINSSTASTPVVGTDGGLGQHLEEFPEVEESVEMLQLPGKTTLRYEGKTFQEQKIYQAERTYFKIFSHSWLAGDPATALAAPKRIVLTQKLAEKYFGQEPPLNKIIQIQDDNFTVTGVIRDLPGHTDLLFDALLSTDHEYLVETSFWCITFILLRDQADVRGLETRLDEVCQKYMTGEVAGTDATIAYDIEALPDVHFGTQKLFDTPKSSRSNIYVFSIVGFFILFIACINYANLAMVLVLKRNTEAGIRKIMGASPAQLLKQYLFESCIVFALGFLLAGVMVFLSLHFFNQLTDKQLSADRLLNFPFLLMFVGVILFAGLLAGSQPALFLSTAKPAQVLKSHDRILKKNRLRNALIVFQFTSSVALMISTKIVYDQWNVLTRTNPGFRTDQILVIDVPRESSMANAVVAVKNDFASFPFVTKVSQVGYNSLPTSSMDIDGYEVEYRGENITRIFNNINVDQDYLELLQIGIKEGRNFTAQELDDYENVILVNAMFVKAMGWEHPLEQTLYRNSEAFQVIGVVNDFHFNSLRKSIEPIVIHGHHGSPEKLMVKFSSVDFPSMMTLEESWKKSIGRPFEAEFLDSYFNQQYKNEKTMQRVLLYFSVFTLLIACMGLLGLVAFFTAQKTKEFGIRKVLGAQFSNVAYRVVKEFLWLVVLGAVLSVPIAWWGMTTWLEEFPYKTTPGIADFAWPVLITLAIALLSMTYHTLRASNASPVESLKES